MPKKYKGKFAIKTSSLSFHPPHSLDKVKIELNKEFVRISGTNFAPKQYKISDINSIGTPFGYSVRHYRISNKMKEYGTDTFSIVIGDEDLSENTIKIDPIQKIFYMPESMLN